VPKPVVLVGHNRSSGMVQRTLFLPNYAGNSAMKVTSSGAKGGALVIRSGVKAGSGYVVSSG
jgi:hypothetical protein